MSEALDGFNEGEKARGRIPFHIGIGINYGVVTVGNIGSEKKMDYTVIGDMVNLASRLSGLTKTYRQRLIISESLYGKVNDDLHCRLLDSVAVKGRKKGIKIYTVKKELLGQRGEGLGSCTRRAWPSITRATSPGRSTISARRWDCSPATMRPAS